MNVVRCAVCGEKMRRNGKTKAGRTRWRREPCGSGSVARIDNAAKSLAASSCDGSSGSAGGRAGSATRSCAGRGLKTILLLVVAIDAQGGERVGVTHEVLGGLDALTRLAKQGAVGVTEQVWCDALEPVCLAESCEAPSQVLGMHGLALRLGYDSVLANRLAKRNQLLGLNFVEPHKVSGGCRIKRKGSHGLSLGCLGFERFGAKALVNRCGALLSVKVAPREGASLATTQSRKEAEAKAHERWSGSRGVEQRAKRGDALARACEPDAALTLLLQLVGILCERKEASVTVQAAFKLGTELGDAALLFLLGRGRPRRERRTG